MNVTISPADGTVGIVLNKVEQDTLEHAVGLASTALRQLKRIETGQKTDPEMLEELRSVIIALKSGASGVVDVAGRA